MALRREEDALGTRELPADVLWGIHTERALHNFPLSGYRVSPALIRSLAVVKKACALANLELGYLPERVGRAVCDACDEVARGRLEEFFPLDALQGGAGTSTNMNLNEVIANRAAVLLGGRPGDCRVVDPLEHVNLHQSTNDVYPTALRVAAISGLRGLAAETASLQGVFQRRENQFAEIVKVARTELREAVPTTLGREFSAFAEAFARDRWRISKCEERLRVINLGGTAVGTGLGAPRRYIFLVVEKLRELTGFGLARAENPVEATANADAFVEVSGILKAYASSQVKVAGDLRLLALLGEIRLGAVQAGSSIMPGKVNPVLAEAVIQCGIRVFANDLAVTEAVSRSTLQICEFLPLVSLSLLESIELLASSGRVLARLAGELEADPARCLDNLGRSPAIVTALLPETGYRRAGELLEEFRVSGHPDLREFLAGKIGREKLERLLSPHNVTGLGWRDPAPGAGPAEGGDR